MAQSNAPQQHDTTSVGHIRRIALFMGIALGLALLGWLFAMILSSQGCQRSLKSFRSDFGGGIERTVTLYDYNGDVLQEWHGTFDLDENDQEVYFDLEGKRTIINGGIVVIQEETQAEYEKRVAQRQQTP